MEISTIIAQDALRGLERVVFVIAAAASAIVLIRSTFLARGRLHALRSAARFLRAHVSWRILPLIGLPTAFPTAAAIPTASFTRFDQLSSHRVIEPPWAGVGGFSPPRLLARPRGSTSVRSYVHPAIHGAADSVSHPREEEALVTRVVSPLFPRARGSSAHAITGHRIRVPIEKRRAMRVHPAGSALPDFDASLRGAQRGRRYVVQHGDTLWGIAEETLNTSDARRIARYWPRIHRANLDVVGRDPNLVYPGQVLHLPPEK